MASRVLRTGGLYFDGMDDYILVPESSSLEFGTGSVTLEAWIATLVSRSQLVLEKGAFGGSIKGFYCGIHGTDFKAQFDDGSITVEPAFPASLIRDGKFHHVVVVLDRVNNKARIYLDSILKNEVNASGLGSITNTAKDLLIGGSIFWNGFIDEVRIYNRALSQTEISEIYTRGMFIKDGLVLCLPFYEGEGNIVHDVSGYNNHGTIYGNPVWAVKKALAR